MGRAFDGRKFKTLRAILKREQRNCWLCRQPIDYALPSDHPESFSADHVIPYAQDPELALVYGNLDAAHLTCNKSRGDRAVNGLGNADNQW